MAGIDDILDAEDLRMLMDIGFMALSRGLDAPAEAVFAGVVAARPAQEAGHIGMAMVQLFRGQPEQALATLRALPQSDAVSTFVGLALSRYGDRQGARDVLSRVAGAGPDSAFSEGARGFLNGLER